MSGQDNTLQNSNENPNKDPRGKDQSTPPPSLGWALSLITFSCMVLWLLAEQFPPPDALEGLLFIALVIGLVLGVFAPFAIVMEFCGITMRGGPPVIPGRTLLQAVLFWGGAVAICFNFFFSYPEDKPHPVSRIKGDMRTTTIALETYYLDNNEYPAWTRNAAHNVFGSLTDQKGVLRNLPSFTRHEGPALATLTTPISYISGYFTDPFAPVKGASFCYWTPGRDSHPDPARNDNQTSIGGTGYILWSPGPDGVYDLTLENIARAYNPAAHVPSPYLVGLTYDPSNGTASRGDVYRVKQ